MSDRKKDKEEEKMQLWHDVMESHRASLARDSGSEVKLETGSDQQIKAETEKTLRRTDEAMAELNAILQKQKT